MADEDDVDPEALRYVGSPFTYFAVLLSVTAFLPHWFFESAIWWEPWETQWWDRHLCGPLGALGLLLGGVSFARVRRLPWTNRFVGLSLFAVGLGLSAVVFGLYRFLR